MYMSRLIYHPNCLDIGICYMHLFRAVHITHIYVYVIDFLVYVEVPKVNPLIKALIPILRLIIRYKEKKRWD